MASNVVPLFKPEKKKCRWYRDENDGKWYYHYWKLDELAGRKPRGPPQLKFGPRGKVLLAKKQVWVELDSDELWVISSLRVRDDGKHIVYLKHYLLNEESRRITETTLRSSMMVYEEALRPITPGPRQKLTPEGKTTAVIIQFPTRVP